jgi:hypothetical protein
MICIEKLKLILLILYLHHHAFNTFLYLNHINKKPETIILPPVEIQLELKKALHGGFTFCFNKKNDRKPDSITTYVDATSLSKSIFKQITV